MCARTHFLVLKYLPLRDFASLCSANRKSIFFRRCVFSACNKLELVCRIRIWPLLKPLLREPLSLDTASKFATLPLGRWAKDMEEIFGLPTEIDAEDGKMLMLMSVWHGPHGSIETAFWNAECCAPKSGRIPAIPWNCWLSKDKRIGEEIGCFP